jgi:hypothetical protein
MNVIIRQKDIENTHISPHFCFDKVSVDFNQLVFNPVVLQTRKAQSFNGLCPNNEGKRHDRSG